MEPSQNPRTPIANETPEAFCTCSGSPHTPACRSDRWAVKRSAEMAKACGVARLPQAPEIKRQAAKRLLILGRLQDGPATGYELFAAGGGFRYAARLHELRQAGHNITTENLGEGVFRYTLITP